MKSDRLENMFRGWFVGAFTPTVLHTDACEVAIQRYAKGDYEGRHMHKVATEVTAVIEGSVRMCDREWNAGDIISIPPGEATDFLALTDAMTVVVKYPGAINDKYVMDME